MSKWRLYSIGMLMGFADLIPGISGGTVAFLCGIYEKLLDNIKNFRIQTFKSVAWPFLVPLFAGIVTSVFGFSKLVYYVMIHFQAPLFGFFFGLILATTVVYGRKADLKRPSHCLLMLVGASVSFMLTVLPSQLLFGTGFFGLMLAGLLATGAMLLPGISGTFVLQVIGVYPLVMHALAVPSAPGSVALLATVGCGIALGFIVFSRVITFLLHNFKGVTFAILVGFMAGGLKALWPFARNESLIISICCTIAGFILFILLETKTKRLKSQSGTI